MGVREAAEIVRAHLAGEPFENESLNRAIRRLCELGDGPQVTVQHVTKILQEIGKLWQELPSQPGYLHTRMSVLSLRFGLMGGVPTSFDDIEKLIHIPREDARDIENELLGRLQRAANE